MFNTCTTIWFFILIKIGLFLFSKFVIFICTIIYFGSKNLWQIESNLFLFAAEKSQLCKIMLLGLIISIKAPVTCHSISPSLKNMACECAISGSNLCLFYTYSNNILLAHLQRKKKLKVFRIFLSHYYSRLFLHANNTRIFM